MDLHCFGVTTSLSRSLGASVHSVGALSTLVSHAGELSTSPKLVGWTGTLGTGAGGSGKGGAVDDGTCAEILDGGAGAVTWCWFGRWQRRCVLRWVGRVLPHSVITESECADKSSQLLCL